MAATANSYIPDKGEITFTIDAAGAAATGLTAGTYTADIVVRSFQPSEEPARSSAQVNVTGGTINVAGGVKGRYVYDLVIVDDYAKGSTGELGSSPNEFTVLEAFQQHWLQEVTMDELTVTPAGSTAGMIEYTIAALEVTYVQAPGVDADAEGPAERTIRVSFDKDDLSEAAHA